MKKFLISLVLVFVSITIGIQCYKSYSYEDEKAYYIADNGVNGLSFNGREYVYVSNFGFPENYEITATTYMSECLGKDEKYIILSKKNPEFIQHWHYFCFINDEDDDPNRNFILSNPLWGGSGLLLAYKDMVLPTVENTVVEKLYLGWNETDDEEIIKDIIQSVKDKERPLCDETAEYVLQKSGVKREVYLKFKDYPITAIYIMIPDSNGDYVLTEAYSDSHIEWLENNT